MTTTHSAPVKPRPSSEHAAEAITSAINLRTTATVAEANRTE